MSVDPAEFTHADGAAQPQLFVINLCASTSPMALSHPSDPELRRYNFFVTRQRDEGRERFRLHMGYFASQEDAEQMQGVVRDIYPAAWVAPAPAGGPRRNRIASPVRAAQPAAVVPAANPPAVVSPAAAAPVADVLDTMSNVRVVLEQLSEPQVLRVLETPEVKVAVPDADVEVRTVTHENELATLAGCVVSGKVEVSLEKEEAGAPKCFAVQLIWSGAPIDVASLPHLAIFEAYTLYNVEGNRDGRKWYGLRLGFFSDPEAATQVANYVRSDYRAVSIVPVASKERDRAGGSTVQDDASGPRLGEGVHKSVSGVSLDMGELQGFELLADDHPAPQKLDLDDKPGAAAPVIVPTVKPVASVKKVAGKPGKPAGKRAVARKRPTPPGRAPGAAAPNESTLELLGASALTLDNTRAVMEDPVVRKPVTRQGGNRFARLLGRLGGG